MERQERDKSRPFFCVLKEFGRGHASDLGFGENYNSAYVGQFLSSCNLRWVRVRPQQESHKFFHQCPLNLPVQGSNSWCELDLFQDPGALSLFLVEQALCCMQEMHRWLWY